MATMNGSPARKRVVVGTRALVPALAAMLAASACDSTASKSAPTEQATGTRARGEEGAMGASTPSAYARRVDSVASLAKAGAGGPSDGSGGGRMDYAEPQQEYLSGPAAPASQAPGTALGMVGHATSAAPSPIMAKRAALAKPEAASAGMIGILDNPLATAAPQGRGAWAAAEPPAPIARTTPRLDPNARYATTYRPGGAALAAFDSAVRRGQIPASYRDLVGDFGARYAPALAAPQRGALTIAVQTERGAVAPSGGSTNLLVALASSEAMPPRAPLSVHIVLDVSGSMSGQAIEDAKHAAEAAVDKLEPADDFSMVTFSNEAQVLVPDGPIGPRRAQVLARIQGVQADGGTNISAGLDLGYAEAHAPGVSDEAVRLVMLLSDGHANAGDTGLDHLADRAARAFQDGIQTSSFGLGPDYDAALMSKIADRGAGGYYYLADSSQIAPALSREIDARLRPVATAVEIRVRLRPDISASHVFGSRELSADEADAVRAQELAVDRHEARRNSGIAADRQTDAEGGMRFFIPAFAPADRHATMVTLQLPPGTGERRVASVEVRYKDRLLEKNVTQELPVSLRWAASDAESASTASHDVERVEQAFAAGETILEAAEDVDHGDRQGARQVLDERAAVLRSAAALLGEPRFVEDAGRLERLADAVGGTQAIADALPLVVMLRGSGYGYL